MMENERRRVCRSPRRARAPPRCARGRPGSTNHHNPRRALPSSPRVRALARRQRAHRARRDARAGIGRDGREPLDAPVRAARGRGRGRGQGQPAGRPLATLPHDTAPRGRPDDSYAPRWVRRGHPPHATRSSRRPPRRSTTRSSTRPRRRSSTRATTSATRARSRRRSCARSLRRGQTLSRAREDAAPRVLEDDASRAPPRGVAVLSRGARENTRERTRRRVRSE